MSEGNFEVMPVGTIAELAALRKFAYDMVSLGKQYDIIIPKTVLDRINEIDRFYSEHNLNYIV